MNDSSSKQKGKSQSPNQAFQPYSPQASTDEILQHLHSLGKIIVSRAELQQLMPYSARTIRRFELRGVLKPLKGVRTKSYLVADLARFISEVR